jgi:outer membrane protein OmpA-like peptidoglycan-associated protein
MLLATTMACLPALAQAQSPPPAPAPAPNWYIGGGLGVNQLMDTGLAHQPGSKVKSYVGPVGVISVGVGIGPAIRLELEGDFRGQSSRLTPGNLRADSISFGPMFNALYDFHNDSAYTPYTGVGGGAQWMQFNNGVSKSSAAPAAQGIIGVAYQTDTPGLSLTAEARALGLLKDARIAAGHLQNPINVSGLIGVRYAFNTPQIVLAPPPPPPAPITPAPVAQTARSYLVFFDWDSTELTGRARQIVTDAATASQRLNVTRIEVAGNTDTSGTPQYNLGLSRRRADVVAALLVEHGVPNSAISITALGDTQPLVPTGPGVREPQNRRVQIVLK